MQTSRKQGYSQLYTILTYERLHGKVLTSASGETRILRATGSHRRTLSKRMTDFSQREIGLAAQLGNGLEVGRPAGGER